MKEPKKPTDKKQFKKTVLDSYSNRAFYYSGQGSWHDKEYYVDEADEILLEEENEEELGFQNTRFGLLSLSKINNIVKEKNIDPEKVFINVEYEDDYLTVTAEHIVELSKEEITAKYESDMKKYAEYLEEKRKRELADVERQMQALQNKKNKLQQ